MLGEELLVFAAVCKENNLAGLIRLRDDLQYFGRTGSRAGDYDLDRFGNRSIHGSRHLWECGGGALEDRMERADQSFGRNLEFFHIQNPGEPGRLVAATELADGSAPS